jgi:hypothetical protein
LYPTLVQSLRDLSQRSRPGAFDLPDYRKDIGSVLIGGGFVRYSSGLVRRLTGFDAGWTISEVIAMRSLGNGIIC